jgi:hypothetical protein
VERFGGGIWETEQAGAFILYNAQPSKSKTTGVACSKKRNEKTKTTKSTPNGVRWDSWK